MSPREVLPNVEPLPLMLQPRLVLSGSRGWGAGVEAGEFCWRQLPSTSTSCCQPSYLPLLGEDLLIIQPAFSPDIAEGCVREVRGRVSLRRSVGIIGSTPAIQGLQGHDRGPLRVAPTVPACQEAHRPRTATQAWWTPVLCGLMGPA